MDNLDNISAILRHIKKVEDNCNYLAKKLINENEELSLESIKLGRLHDISKFDEYEFKYLGSFEENKSPEFIVALKIHHSKNPHHPENWRSIHEMREKYVAEMVCDCVARGQEFGTDTRKWFEDVATIKYNFKMSDPVGLLITKYLNLLLSKPFT